MARLTRIEQSRANRQRILASARTHFEQSGYHGASVDLIAEDAGFSKGAIYSQFGSKDELMLALLEANIEERQQASQRLVDSLGADGRIEDVMRDAIGLSLRSPAWQAALTEFRIHAWRHSELNERYRALHERTIDKVAATVARLLPSGDPDLPRDFAVAVLAANTGLVIEALTGDAIDVSRFLETIGSLSQTGTASSEESVA